MDAYLAKQEAKEQAANQSEAKQPQTALYDKQGDPEEQNLSNAQHQPESA